MRCFLLEYFLPVKIWRLILQTAKQNVHDKKTKTTY